MKEWRRIDGNRGGTGKVIKNSSYRCFWNTSKWHAWQCQRWAWCIIEMMPTWHLALTSHARFTCHVGDTLGHTSLTQTKLPMWWRASGETAHMLNTDLKGTKLGHVQFANLASWMRSEEAGNVRVKHCNTFPLSSRLYIEYLGVNISLVPMRFIP